MFKKYLIISGLLLLPIVLIVLPADFFDHGKSLCISQLLLDTECPGCGMTRACMHIIHFNFSTAWTFNKISFIVFPILAGLYGVEVVKWTRKVL